MLLEGLHHVTCMTGDAQQNADFYVGILGLRMVKKTINQDDPSVYHLFYADEGGSPGSDITFFEYRGAPPGRAGDGMVHEVAWRVASAEALDFWAERFERQGVTADRSDGGDNVRGSGGPTPPVHRRHEWRRAALRRSPRDPRGVRPGRVRRRASVLGESGAKQLGPRGRARLHARREAAAWSVRGDERGGTYRYDTPPAAVGRGGAGTVHHVAFAIRVEDAEAWVTHLRAAGVACTPVIDRFWFRSIYFREPSGVLFELATMGPGFDVDEDPAHLGEKLILPPRFESMRAQIERGLVPVTNPRWWT